MFYYLKKGRSTRNMKKLYEKYITGKRIPDFDKSALLVIDMQKYFSAISSLILPNINNLIRGFREKGRPVIFTRHGHRNPEEDAGMLYEWWGGNIIEGTEEYAFMDTLLTHENDIVIKKMRYSAFYRTNLDNVLEKQRIEELLITGVMTNLCCETTARDAFIRDYKVHFMIDGTATSDLALHEATLMNLAYGFAYLHECREIMQHLHLSL